MIKEKLSLDDRDHTIVTMLQNNPSVSQEEIARTLKLSQPSVWARIKKLKEKGVISNIVGVNFKTVDLHLAKIDVSSTDTQGVIDEFKGCPFFLNALVTSGRYNLCLFFAGTSLKNIEGMVNHHLRGNPKVKEVEMNLIVSAAKDFVLPIGLEANPNCDQDCRKSVE